MAWVAVSGEPDTRYCEEHEETFLRSRVCSRCKAARTQESKAPPRELHPVVRRLTLDASAAQDRADSWSARAEACFDKNELGHAQRIGTLALQYTRFAEELRQRAEDLEHDVDLVEHDRVMAGIGRGAH